MTLAQRVVAYLEERQVASALIGAMALAVHGIARATYDSDLLLTDRRVLTQEFWRHWTGSPRPEIRTGDLDDPLAGVVSIRESGAVVDLVVGREPWMASVLTRRAWIEVGEGPLPVVDRADLVVLKLYAAGPQDLVDIQLLVAADPDLRLQVESRLAAVPAALRSVWTKMGSGSA